jgi:hypothetical protein
MDFNDFFTVAQRETKHVLCVCGHTVADFDSQPDALFVAARMYEMAREGWDFSGAKMRAMSELAAREVFDAAPLELAPEPIPAPEKPRCLHYKAIRRAFAIAREAGLDTRADEKMRAAFARVLGRVIESREELSGGDWLLVGNAIKTRHLAW